MAQRPWPQEVEINLVQKKSEPKPNGIFPAAAPNPNAKPDVR